MDAMIEKAPVTVILSAKGWIRGASGHEALDKEFKFKEGDGPAFALHCQTTDKLLIACDNGRFYTLGADKLPSARGFGEPLRSMIDIDADAQIVGTLFEDTRFSRRLCGQGSFDIPRFLRESKAAGFDAPYYGIEIINQTFRKQSLEVMAKTSFDTAMAEVRRAFN